MERRQFIKNTSIASTALLTGLAACNNRYDTEVLILGGGFSGLCLAHLLDSKNIDYILLEGSQRLGGRMFMHPDIKRDVGGRGIGDKYLETMKIVQALDIELIDISSEISSPTSIYLNGTLYPDWKDSKTNPRLLEFTSKADLSLEYLEEWYQRPDMDLSYAEYLTRNGLSKEELDLINISSNYNDIYKTSVLNRLHSSAFRKFNGSKKIYNFKGGTGNFISKIEKSLLRPIKTGKFITAISDNKESIQVTCADGSSYSAASAVTTLPFSTLRDVNISVTLNKNQIKAIQALEYTRITQIHFDAKEKFWEQDAAPPSMWTDTPLERIMDVNADPDTYHLAAWINGKGTHAIDKMTDNEIKDFTLKEMAKIRPASEGKLEYIGTHSWGNYKFSKGAYAEFLPGQAAWFEDMIRPAGRLHFAGEHTAKASRGIEGAAESARRVFNELTA